MDIIKKGTCLLVYLKEKDFHDRKCSNTVNMGIIETPRVGDIIFIREDDFDEKRIFRYKVQLIERKFIKNMSAEDIMSEHIDVHAILYDYKA